MFTPCILRRPRSYAPFFLQMKKPNRVKFHQYSIVVAKLKFCVLILHPCRAHFWSAFYLFIRQIYSGFAENFIRGIIPAEQVSVWIIFEKFEVLWERDGPKIYTLVQRWPPVTSWRWPKSRKITISLKNYSYQAILIWQNQGPFSSPFLGNYGITFCQN